MIDRIAQALSSLTGRFYPLIAPTIGAIGTFVTGSDTSANVLFGQLQSQTALQLKLSPVWLAAANTAGATAGKMLSPQNIAIAATATGLLGKEGIILNKTFKICLVYTAILGIIVFLT
jgi:lactate permease